jgi:hypothetical protein
VKIHAVQYPVLATDDDDLGDHAVTQNEHERAVADPVLDAPHDTFPELPDAPEPGPDGGGPEWDPVTELATLTMANAGRMNELAKGGVMLQDSHTMITMQLLTAMVEEVLRIVGGDGAVTRVLLAAHQQIADMLTNAESQVRQAKIAAGVPQHNGRVTKPGRI